MRNLIVAAIGVMKSRKARPDTKRICNWIHRRYGRPYGSVSDELDRLVAAGELSRVDYKGSVSFRVNVESKGAEGDGGAGEVGAPIAGGSGGLAPMGEKAKEKKKAGRKKKKKDGSEKGGGGGKRSAAEAAAAAERQLREMQQQQLAAAASFEGELLRLHVPIFF